jgi:hypothetical protein
VNDHQGYSHTTDLYIIRPADQKQEMTSLYCHSDNKVASDLNDEIKSRLILGNAYYQSVQNLWSTYIIPGI